MLVELLFRSKLFRSTSWGCFQIAADHFLDQLVGAVTRLPTKNLTGFSGIANLIPVIKARFMV
jgi:hypothetical protein